MKNPMAYVHNENHGKKIVFLRRFSVKEHRHSETISGEKGYLCRSTPREEVQKTSSYAH